MPFARKLNTRSPDSSSPATRVVPVAPDDAADLPGGQARFFFVGAAGAVTVIDAQGNQARILSAGSQYHPIQIRRVLATGTDAGDILAFY